MLTCATCLTPGCSLSWTLPYLWSDNRENPGLRGGAGGCQGEGTRGWRVRTSWHLPGQLPLASPREAGLLRAEHLSFLSVLRPDTCSGAKDETPEAEPGSVRGNVCPRNTTPRSQDSRPVSGQALAAFRVKTLAPFCWWNCSYFYRSLETLPLFPEPRDTTKEHVLLCIFILQIRKLKIMPCGRQNESKIKTPFHIQSKGSVEVTGLTASYLSFRYSRLCHEPMPARTFTAQADCRLPSPGPGQKAGPATLLILQVFTEGPLCAKHCVTCCGYECSKKQRSLPLRSLHPSKGENINKQCT